MDIMWCNIVCINCGNLNLEQEAIIIMFIVWICTVHCKFTLVNANIYVKLAIL